MKPGHNVWFIGVFSMTMISVIRIFFRKLTGNAAGDKPDIAMLFRYRTMKSVGR
jgi:hypothetical protein